MNIGLNVQVLRPNVSPYLLKPLRSYQQAAQDYNLKRMKEVLGMIRQVGIVPREQEK